MPSLIRLLVALLFLGALVYGGMLALVVMVEPTPDEVRVRVPTATILGEDAAPARSGPDLGIRSNEDE
ncbi:hypothetical protein GCM10007989_23120 [Devosia pacifica]|uniref:Histidine kinase n=1 Tax=Devosia pacifica TaxID=1335967 RepID=A0A918S7V2_9HYPH|nr:histidine kinase [Devosia pacifica]GHA26685.1 hypothetical protein GCM10007989_23120 [Devosia pacifica]